MDPLMERDVVRESVVQHDAWMFRPLHVAEFHLFEHGGDPILFDVMGGAFFHVDQVVLDILEHAEGCTVIEILEQLQTTWPEKEVVSAYKELYDAEVITDMPIADRPFHPPGRLEVVHLGMDITYDTLDGPTGFYRDEAAFLPSDYMSEDVALRAVDLLMKESGHIRKCQVTFQGGDPLLNPNLLARVIEYGREKAEELGKEIVFQVKGSGRLLNERALGDLKRIDADIVIDIADDTSETEELPLFRGSGPFSLAPASLDKLGSEGGARLHLRQVRPDNVDLSRHLDELLRRYPAARTITLSVGSEDGSHLRQDPQVTEASLEAFAGRVRKHVASGGAAWIGDFEDAISQVYNQKCSMYHCGAGTRYLTVSPDGGIYVCPGLVRNEAFKVGTVHDGIDRPAQRRWIKETHVEKFDACASCWARYLCGGGCRLEAFQESGDIRKPVAENCAVIRRTYELAMGTCLDIAEVDEARLHERYAEAG